MFTQQGRFPVLSVPLPGLALFVRSSIALPWVRYGDKVWINRKRSDCKPESRIILPFLVIFSPLHAFIIALFQLFALWSSVENNHKYFFSLLTTFHSLSLLWKLVLKTLKKGLGSTLFLLNIC